MQDLTININISLVYYLSKKVCFINICVQSHGAPIIFIIISLFLYFKRFVANLYTVCQVKWLLKLSQIPQVTEVPRFSEAAQSYLQGVIDDFSLNDALEIKTIERVTNHDVKAMEYFLKHKCKSHPEIAHVGTHFNSFF